MHRAPSIAQFYRAMDGISLRLTKQEHCHPERSEGSAVVFQRATDTSNQASQCQTRAAYRAFLGSSAIARVQSLNPQRRSPLQIPRVFLRVVSLRCQPDAPDQVLELGLAAQWVKTWVDLDVQQTHIVRIVGLL